MKKLTAIFLAGALALSLTACGSKMKANNYSIEEEAKYYHELTGEEISCTLSISTHPSLQCSALTMPTVENTINDIWYNEQENADVTMSVYKTMTVNDTYGTDTALTLTFTGSAEKLDNGFNTETFSKYLERYFKNGERKKIVKFIKDEVNNDITRHEITYKGDYSVGGLDCTFSNKDGSWTLTINAYYNNEVSDGGLYIDKTLAQEKEPNLNEETITSLIGENDMVVDYKTVIDIDELIAKMKKIDYELLNQKYQHDETVTETVTDENSSTTYYMSVVFKPTSGEGKNAVVQQSLILDEANKTVVYKINALNEEISDDEVAKIISAVSGVKADDVKKILSEKGTEVSVSDNAKAVIDNERNFSVTVTLE